MTINITTDVFCECGDWVHGCTGRAPHPAAARKKAARQGWVRRWNAEANEYQDMCPRCQGLEWDQITDTWVPKGQSTISKNQQLRREREARGEDPDGPG